MFYFFIIIHFTPGVCLDVIKTHTEFIIYKYIYIKVIIYYIYIYNIYKYNYNFYVYISN